MRFAWESLSIDTFRIQIDSNKFNFRTIYGFGSSCETRDNSNQKRKKKNVKICKHLNFMQNCEQTARKWENKKIEQKEMAWYTCELKQKKGKLKISKKVNCDFVWALWTINHLIFTVSVFSKTFQNI